MAANKTARVTHGSLQVDAQLDAFVNDELLPASDVEAADFWAGLESIINELGPKNRQLLEERDQLQAAIDAWHVERRGKSFDPAVYKSFLSEIGYLEKQGNSVEVNPRKIDTEIASVAGPQLVVPVDNARYALNAANARWGSLYDALYGTNITADANGCGLGAGYNPIRGDAVVSQVRDLLDAHFPLEYGSHRWASSYSISGDTLTVTFGDSQTTTLIQPGDLGGYRGDPSSPEGILLSKHGLHLEIVFGDDNPIGRRDAAGIADVRLESALSVIMDLEDSVASVDAEDKIRGYRNWLQLMQGTLKASFTKGKASVNRELSADFQYRAVDGSEAILPGRSLMLVRNAGGHLLTDAVLYDGEPVAETFVDAMVTALAGKHDLIGTGPYRNSRSGSIYIVKPKMHGSKEVALAVELFAKVESIFDLDANTLKMGIMDEERRTSINLGNCIATARDRLFFINTGFLDRTGDEIHTSMEAGAVLPKDEMKGATWLKAYEDSNVDNGLDYGLSGHAQIGKGMWAMPDEMQAMMKAKIGHPKSGASTAWVPSPTAATLHALHYLMVDVAERQAELASRDKASVDDILTLPLIPDGRELSRSEIERELQNNAQGILGYVARWVGQGVGCSKVPDINNIGLMEDCATLRISSQHIANWLHHGILTEDEVHATMQRMAVVVDRQNAGDPAYSPMAPDFETSIPYKAALDLALKGRVQPNGYTEFILYDRRREMKSAS